MTMVLKYGCVNENKREVSLW